MWRAARTSRALPGTLSVKLRFTRGTMVTFTRPAAAAEDAAPPTAQTRPSASAIGHSARQGLVKEEAMQWDRHDGNLRRLGCVRGPKQSGKEQGTAFAGKNDDPEQRAGDDFSAVHRPMLAAA